MDPGTAPAPSPPRTALFPATDSQVELYQVAEWASFGVRAFFTGRRGGVSAGPYSSLNLAYHVGDDEVAVRENRRRVGEDTGFPWETWVSAGQVHGRQVAVVGAKDQGRGAVTHSTALPQTDGMVTNAPGVVLAAYFADCVPVLIFDPENRVIGLAHAGWRGTVLKTPQAVLEVMCRSFGTRAESCQVCLGPHIGPCCYQVGEEVRTAGEQAFGPAWGQVWRYREGKGYLDLAGANVLALAEAGVVPGNIQVADACTSCHHQAFFSYRAAGGVTGRFATLIGLA